MNEHRNPSAETPSDMIGDKQDSGTAPTHAIAQTTFENRTRPAAPAVGCIVLLLFWLVLILSLVSIISPSGPEFLRRSWRWWVIGGGGSILLVLLLWLFRHWFPKAAELARTGVVVFIVLPVLLAGFGTVFLMPRSEYQITALRSTFLVAVCLFPALLYYLFIAARKFSLLNDYFVNLNRLGLLQACSSSTEIECNVRLRNYVQKFEALYGAIVPDTLRKNILSADDPLTVLAAPKWMSPGRDSDSPGTIFTAETAIPVVLATVVIATGWLIALPPTGFGKVRNSDFWSMVFQVNPVPITYAFLGAYFFSLQMLFRRYVREDLRKSAYLAVSLRIVLAVIGTWVVIEAIKTIPAFKEVPANHASFLVVGFVIGVFPKVAWQFIQGAWKALMQQLGLAKRILPSMETRMPISDLDGLTVWHEVRLEEEDIENIPNMATTDIIDLMLRTRFPPDRIIDWVDQAILFTHLGPNEDGEKNHDGNEKSKTRRESLRLYGIRTATSLIKTFYAAEGRQDAREVENMLSEALGAPARSFLDAIKTESNLALLRAWRNMPEPCVRQS